MDIKKIGIANFKSFSTGIQEFPAKPIILIFGPNSAGKSSLLQSLFYLEHAIATGQLDIVRPQLASAGMDLGGFDQIKNRQSGLDLISFSFELSPKSLEPSARHWLPAKHSYRLIIDVGRQSDLLGLKSVSLEVDGAEILRAREQGDHLRISSLNTAHPSLSKLLAILEPRQPIETFDPVLDEISKKEDQSSLNAFLDGLITQNCYLVQRDGILPKSLDHVKNLDIDDFDFDKGESYMRFFSAWGDHLQDFQTQWLPDAFNPIFDAFAEKLKFEFSKLTHVPPLRELPPRVYDISQTSDSIWRRIATDSSVRSRINDWLGAKFMKSRYQLQLRHFLPFDEIENSLRGAMDQQVRAIIEKEEFSMETGQIFQRIRDEYDEMDKVAYLRSNPDLFEQLLEHDLEDTLEFEEISGSDNLSRLPAWRQRQYLIEKIEGICSGNDDRYEDMFYHDYIWGHFRDHHVELEEHISSVWDPDRATPTIAKRLQAEATQKRVEIVLASLPSNQIVSLQDVGVGISQVLPVLMSSFGGSQAIVAIEQPEIHIHPALQAELADVFIESALGPRGNTFLLETHSEHLILRLLRRIRETTDGDFSTWPSQLIEACPQGIRPEDIAVLYVQPRAEGAEIIELPVDSNGEFTCDWPGGFFEERIKELF